MMRSRIMREYAPLIPGITLDHRGICADSADAALRMAEALTALATRLEGQSPEAGGDSEVGGNSLGVDILPRQQFRFRGILYAIPGETQWNLFTAIIDGNGQASFSDLGEAGWGDDCYPKGKVSSGVRDLREKLKRLGCGLVVTELDEIAYLSQQSSQ